MLVCCCGVGGTGKTVAVKAFLERNPTWTLLPSIVRDYYALRGVASEGDYLRYMPPEGRYEFQIGLLEYYMHTTENAVGLSSPARNFIMDRSAFDHVAYCVYAHPDMDAAQLEAAMAFGRRFRLLDPVVMWFPYPVSWTGTGAAEDGFRSTGYGKNFVVCSIMERVLRDLNPGRTTVVREGTPDERARIMELRAGVAP